MLRFILLISFIFSSAIHAEPFGDADKGKIKSPSCVYCHGVTGIATNNTYPSLAGQNAQYLYNVMKSYQAGERKGPLAEMMAAQLKMLNDEDLRDVAAFYAEQTEIK
ncbi:c-type cytochrome [Vibrio alginolyticus]|uniref:c-type cytochrome n=1 Tax=Vibrio alginolyticus TaxID=663 RepID=UPI0015F63E82|nr:cytochrome c [Vibrio alginolyticus]MCR9311547.1 cytochrome c [Vibrio alginolyticus]MCR9319849.1 cytochrome c [Vibrio alginolyticus]MCR9405485.1 cytochrome c [Vibrio alginolyticus]MCR9468650.1 cytochrome c [Vibrio alginolyticus]MCR9482722.1 cytochrome c [Vibrio alginolyticus]